MPNFASFYDFSIDHHYELLPNNWSIAVADVQGSTQAVERGAYKQVNAIGVASIIAITNACPDLQLPYVFGGDGASICIPNSRLEAVKQALMDTQKLATETFQLTLRIGIVPIEAVRAQGFEVKLAKLRSSESFQQAMFNGGGLSFAEDLIKRADHLFSGDKNPYTISEHISPSQSSFDGFECRWNAIPSPHEEVVALLVNAQHGEDSDKIFNQVTSIINHIYGDETEYHPLREHHLHMSFSFKKLLIESKIHTREKGVMSLLGYLSKLIFLSMAGSWLMNKSKRTKKVDWGNYKKIFIRNTDYRKFDDTLRMIIAGTKAQREQLKTELELLHHQGLIYYGMHASKNAMVTCFIKDYHEDHVHFLDADDGGYAMAAKHLKQQSATE